MNQGQLLFLNGSDVDAERTVTEALQLSLEPSAQLEGRFYLLAHTHADPERHFRMIHRLIESGGRLRWAVERNIELVRKSDDRKADLLQQLADACRRGDVRQLAATQGEWLQRR